MKSNGSSANATLIKQTRIISNPSMRIKSIQTLNKENKQNRMSLSSTKFREGNHMLKSTSQRMVMNVLNSKVTRVNLIGFLVWNFKLELLF